jgi:hypothetical protein
MDFERVKCFVVGVSDGTVWSGWLLRVATERDVLVETTAPTSIINLERNFCEKYLLTIE